MRKKRINNKRDYIDLDSLTNVPRKGSITVSSKRRLRDTILWKNDYVRVEYMIDNHPLVLWDMIHERKEGQMKVSLVRPAYAILKSRVEQLNPVMVEKVKRQFHNHKIKRKLLKDIANGTIGTSKSRFKRLNSRETKK